MKTGIILGSVREGRQGINVANYVREQIIKSGDQVELIDPKELDLDMMYNRFQDMQNPPEKLTQLSETLKSCDGFIFVTAEYNSSIPPALKNLIDYFTTEFYKKPASVISYSMGDFAGLIAASHLKLALINLGMIIVPHYMPVPAIHTVFDESGKLLKEEYEKRVLKLIEETKWFEELLAKN